MPVEDRLPGSEEIAEMHRILHKLLEREQLTAVEVRFLSALRIDAPEQVIHAR